MKTVIALLSLLLVLLGTTTAASAVESGTDDIVEVLDSESSSRISAPNVAVFGFQVEAIAPTADTVSYSEISTTLDGLGLDGQHSPFTLIPPGTAIAPSTSTGCHGVAQNPNLLQLCIEDTVGLRSGRYEVDVKVSAGTQTQVISLLAVVPNAGLDYPPSYTATLSVIGLLWNNLRNGALTLPDLVVRESSVDSSVDNLTFFPRTIQASSATTISNDGTLRVTDSTGGQIIDPGKAGYYTVTFESPARIGDATGTLTVSAPQLDDDLSISYIVRVRFSLIMLMIALLIGAVASFGLKRFASRRVTEKQAERRRQIAIAHAHDAYRRFPDPDLFIFLEAKLEELRNVQVDDSEALQEIDSISADIDVETAAIEEGLADATDYVIELMASAEWFDPEKYSLLDLESLAGELPRLALQIKEAHDYRSLRRVKAAREEAETLIDAAISSATRHTDSGWLDEAVSLSDASAIDAPTRLELLAMEDDLEGAVERARDSQVPVSDRFLAALEVDSTTEAARNHLRQSIEDARTLSQRLQGLGQNGTPALDELVNDALRNDQASFDGQILLNDAKQVGAAVRDLLEVAANTLDEEQDADKTAIRAEIAAGNYRQAFADYRAAVTIGQLAGGDTGEVFATAVTIVEDQPQVRPPDTSAVDVTQSLPYPTISDEVKAATSSYRKWRLGTEAMAGLVAVVIGFMLFAPAWGGTFGELSAAFAWAFGIDLAVSSIANLPTTKG